MIDPCVSRLLSRRGLLQFGATSYLGLNLGGLWRAQASNPAILANRDGLRSCIFVFLYGGPSQLDTFDLKPDAPAEVRGEFRSITTRASGVRICEHLPKLAKWMHKAAIIRSMTHNARLHDSGSIHMLTGRPLEGPDRELFAPLPQQFPSYGSAVAAMKGSAAGEVPFVALPFAFQNVVPTPAQGGGILGSAYDPLQVEVDPQRREYRIDVLQARQGLGPDRVQSRTELLRALQGERPKSSLDLLQQKAVQLLSSERIRQALDITQEPLRVRDRYGSPLEADLTNGGGSGHTGYARHMRGQNFLLARRLVEAGVPFVNIYDFKQQGQNWDSHADNFHQNKQHLLPPLDQGLSALIQDLEDRGLLDSTLIVVAGEFGRTPKINGGAGRDHWPDCASVLLVGGGVQGGAIYGSSDRLAAYPASHPVTPGDLAATIYWRFGIDPTTEIHDQAKRPYQLAAGEPLTKLF